MGIVSKPRSHPALLRCIFGYLSLRERTDIDAGDLRQVIASAPVVQGEKNPEPDADWKEDGSMWRDSIDVAVELGALTRDGDRLTVGDQSLLGAAADEGSFRSALRRRVLAADNTDGLWDGSWSQVAAQEFARIAVWALMKPVDALMSRDAAGAAQKEVAGPDDAKLVENPDQWRVFVRWASALGLTSTLDRALIPDPTVAVRDELDDSFKDAGEVSALDLRDGLVQRIPVLAHGRLAQGITHHLRDGPQKAHPNDAGEGLSVALERLQREGTVGFEVRSDAPSLRLTGAVADPTHVGRRGAAPGRVKAR